ncbi:hypothetical protein AVEN_70203-1 [Araneus ventricosus]|uniref:Uncharacterized protein n=1 Tax=Araneus ventricosus TaxID=182803 RepID=A0A4Y2FFI1_ARAVE|nr:hypothetical protein AVEN_70203-1 [Araneus ventricosus]
MGQVRVTLNAGFLDLLASCSEWRSQPFQTVRRDQNLVLEQGVELQCYRDIDTYSSSQTLTRDFHLFRLLKKTPDRSPFQNDASPGSRR